MYQPPYYLTLRCPDRGRRNFSLTTTFMPTGDNQVLSGFLAVDANAGTEDGKRRRATASCDCSSCRVTRRCRAPARSRTTSTARTSTSQAFTLTLNQFLNQSRQQGSQVMLGNLLTLPVGGGLLYVQPIYVRASGSSAYPLLAGHRGGVRRQAGVVGHPDRRPRRPLRRQLRRDGG